MRWILAAALVVLGPSAASAINCPMGSHPWVDSWGNQICKRFDDGSASRVQGSLDSCPMGTHPWVDSWGNRTCKSFNSPQQLYDTSKGCPMGTYPGVDNWGNQACKRF
jgi:hypothetical protein